MKLVCLGVVAIGTLLSLASTAAAAGPPIPCTSGMNLRSYNAGLSGGRTMTRSAWNGIGQDPDRVDELKTNIVASIRKALPTSGSQLEACRFGGVIDGAMGEVVIIQDTVVRQCILDGSTWGALAAALYCGIAVDLGGISLGMFMVRKPLGICGNNFEQSCDATFADEAQASAACLPYTQGQFATAFGQYQNNQCTY